MSDIVIIGGGYAALSCAEALRQRDEHCNIRIFTVERFCSRPELFFRFKLLTTGSPAAGGGFGAWKDKERFIERNRVEWNEQCRVVHVDRDTKCITVRRLMMDSAGQEADSTQQMNQEFTVSYDKLIFATGGTPNIVQFPLVEREEDQEDLWNSNLENAFSLRSLLDHLQVEGHDDDDENHRHPHNMFVVRNVDEVEALFGVMEHMYWHNRNQDSTLQARTDANVHDIIVIGAGALAIDIVTSILDGFASMTKQQKRLGTGAASVDNANDQENNTPTAFEDVEYLPRVLVLSRQPSLSQIGFSLLQDRDACDLIVARAQEPSLPYHRFVSFVSGASVCEVICSPFIANKDQKLSDTVPSIVQGLSFSHVVSGETNVNEVKCLAIVQAVGVTPNTRLAQEIGLLVGKHHGGIVVNERFQVILDNNGSDSKDMSDPSIYAVGDCVEIPARYGSIGGLTKTGNESITWKNWTSAREMAIECARHIAENSQNISTLWFNQTLRMFGLYVACLGNYGVQSSEPQQGSSEHEFTVIKRMWTPKDWYFLKLVFRNVCPDSVVLVGALLLGPDMKHYRLGTRLLELMRLERPLPKEFADKLPADDFDVSALVKLLQADKEPHTGSVEDLREALKTGKFTVSKTTKKAFKNPLAKKNKSKQSAKNPDGGTKEAKKVFKNPLLRKKAARKSPVHNAPAESSPVSNEANGE